MCIHTYYIAYGDKNENIHKNVYRVYYIISFIPNTYYLLNEYTFPQPSHADAKLTRKGALQFTKIIELQSDIHIESHSNAMKGKG